MPALARQARCLLPEDLLARQGLSAEAVAQHPDAPELAPVLAALRAEGLALLARGRGECRGGRLPRAAIAAALPAVLARRDLGRDVPAQAPGRGIGDRLAVVLAAATGKV